MKALKIRAFYSIIFFATMFFIASTALAALETSDVMGMMDLDKDGNISEQEWTGHPKAFSNYDLDNSGAIEADEIPQELGPPSFKTMDTNGDSQLTREEFIGHGGEERVFKILDKNEDDILQETEDPTFSPTTED